MLISRGSPALSDFRIQKLTSILKQFIPDLQSCYAEFVHFADVDGQLSLDEQQLLARLLEYGPQG